MLVAKRRTGTVDGSVFDYLSIRPARLEGGDRGDWQPFSAEQ